MDIAYILVAAAGAAGGLGAVWTAHRLPAALMRRWGDVMPAAHNIRARASAIVAAPAFAIALLWRFGVSWELASASILALALLTLTLIDVETMLLPDAITLPLIACGILLNIKTGYFGAANSVAGAVVGFGSLWLLNFIHATRHGTDGIGYGDFKLTAALGAWLGAAALPQILLIASLSGLTAWGLGMVKRSERFPFGPLLSIAGVATLLAGVIPFWDF